MQVRYLLVAMALLFAAVQAQACQLRFAMEQWPPYLYRQPGAATPSGLDWDLAQAIFKEAGCKLLVQPELPMARRLHLFEHGELDLMMSASDTPERRTYARFTIAYRHETVGLFTRSNLRKQYRHVTSLDVLARDNLSLLAPKIGWYGPVYARVQPALEAAGKLSTFITFRQGLRMLDAGRADLILGDSAALRYEAIAHGIAISPLPLVVVSAPVHLMLNKNNTRQADIDRINAAITRLEHQGVLAAIRSRYGE
jgi:polar amino acid transport system substrate-binding protein